MGQRLVINVVNDNTRIANFYYHLMAYSISALYEAKTLIDSGVFEDCNSTAEIQLKLIHFIESIGGCIDGGADSKEYQTISKMFPCETFKTDGSRNEGLIAITPETMDSIESWAEGTLEINLDTDTIYNSVYCIVTLEEYNSWMDEEDQKKLEAARRKAEKEVANLEAKITELENKKSELENKLADPAVYSNGEKAKAVQRDIEAVTTEIEETTAAWEAAAEKLG